jgi:hypothetical protein
MGEIPVAQQPPQASLFSRFVSLVQEALSGLFGKVNTRAVRVGVKVALGVLVAIIVMTMVFSLGRRVEPRVNTLLNQVGAPFPTAVTLEDVDRRLFALEQQAAELNRAVQAALAAKSADSRPVVRRAAPAAPLK